jgi:hypothetical protein
MKQRNREGSSLSQSINEAIQLDEDSKVDQLETGRNMVKRDINIATPKFSKRLADEEEANFDILAIQNEFDDVDMKQGN